MERTLVLSGMHPEPKLLEWREEGLQPPHLVKWVWLMQSTCSSRVPYKSEDNTHSPRNVLLTHLQHKRIQKDRRIWNEMEMKDERGRARVEAVLELIRKQTPLTVKQKKFCNNACVERFLKAKGDNVKRAAKQLRACLSWRESIGADHLMADEFSDELADGLAYVAGQDDESRPVSAKALFKCELIIARSCIGVTDFADEERAPEVSFPENVSPETEEKNRFQPFVLLMSSSALHCSSYCSGAKLRLVSSLSRFTRLLVFTMEVAVSTMPKYVQQFVMLFDASFYKSSSAFMNLLMGALKITGEYYPGRLHKAFIIDPPSLFPYFWKGVGAFVELSAVTNVVSTMDLDDDDDDEASADIIGGRGLCSSSRFAFTVSHHVDSLKPWYLTLSDTSASRKTPVPPQRTPRPSFLQSPAGILFRRCDRVSRESFFPLWKLYKRPYDEMVYRSKMKAPLGGHIRRRHISLSQRF
ncbi:unnamed protein product [Sphenostylis stenocarpa]|uniref:CRAL-TRIO domain-containing protein n=1 Tax=Sphenostylis stenocarpa TaxID=92480 RepID=A0AA86V840_9FABA|nr:unnamed protein product [Sphenostylis stenocarpa]